MALPTHYLTSTRNLDNILSSLQAAQAPDKVTISFLSDLGFKSSSDRLLINVFKSLGFLAPDGSPTDRYFRWLNQAESEMVLAEALREAYADLFQLNKNAQNLPRAEIKNKFKTLTQGKASEAVLDKMAMTFTVFAKKADFSAARSAVSDETEPTPEATTSDASGGLALGGLVYTIQIHLPESRDQAVYDALFKSLRSHLLQ